jgi:homoserine O-acetyltransferase
MSEILSSSVFGADQARPLQPEPVCVRDGVVKFEDALNLKSGDVLRDWRMAMRMVGNTELPVVLVIGGISAGRYFWRRARPDGWWQQQFGPGNAGDSDQFCFLSVDFLGGNGGSTGPAKWAGTADSFPPIDTADQAGAIRALLDKLAVKQLHSIIGASYGGMVALQFAAHFPEYARTALVFCASDRASSLASGWRHVQRKVLEFGIASGDSETAMQIARSLAMCTYRSEREFARRFPSPGGSPAIYLDHCGSTFARQFNIYAYRCLSQSIDDHYVNPSTVTIPIDLVGFCTDQIVPPQQLIDLNLRLPGARRLKLIDSPYGHDGFLKEVGPVGRMIRSHLETQS